MPLHTRAAVLVELGSPLEIYDLTIPDLARGQVLVDISYSGICHTQLLEISGSRGNDPFLPHTLGHEASGTVLDIGDNVTKVKKGDPVVLSWIRGNGLDVPSSIYQSQNGSVNSGAISTFMYRAVVSENRLTVIPDAMPLREAALLGCAIPTGTGVVLNTASVTPGSSVAIFGVGGIGLSAVVGANLANATTIIAIDIFDHKLQQALSLGATHVINSKLVNPLDGINEITLGKGVDYSIESAGLKETMEVSFKCVRDNGGLCVLAGNLPNLQEISLDPMDLIKGKRIMGTWGGGANTDRDIILYCELYLANKLSLTEIITHTFELQDVNSAFDALKSGQVGRALIHLS